MTQKAIVSLLWGSQYEALRQFLATHEPMAVLVSARATSPQMRSVIESTGSTVVHLEDLLDAEGVRRFETETIQLQTQFAQYLDTLAVEERAIGRESGLISAAVADTLAATLPATAALLDCLQRAASRFDITLLVTSEDVTGNGKIATAWAKSRGIPTLHVAHGIALVDPYTVHDQLIADKLAVYGRRGMEGYLDLGYPEERFVVTGNPAWDVYAQLRNDKAGCRRQLDAKYGFKAGVPLIVFGTTWAANFSAHCNENVYADSVMVFMASCEALRACGIRFNAVIKDRPSNRAFGERRCAELLSELGASGDDYFYCTDDTQFFAAGADLLVAVDSNYLVEGMLAGTPVINLMNESGMIMGPCFESETGILEVEAQDLAGNMRLLLTDGNARSAVLAMAAKRVAHYNETVDGSAGARVAAEMASMAKAQPARKARYVWQEYLDAESRPVDQLYHTVGRSDLAQMFTNAPSLILDIGCATGSNAALVKARFPGSRAWGIEMNRDAAALAQQKLDRVLHGRFEDFDLRKEGMAHGTLDAVLLADVLEHMYNPWDVMVKLRPYVSPTGQLVLSIPNVRNLWLMDELSKGNWTYESSGLLDITHIRFFTRKEMIKFVEETGYRVVQARYSIDGRLASLWQQHQGSAGPFNIDLERMTLKNVTRDELVELCSVQYYLLLEKAPEHA
jgi:2-polyprenyl-3-methyl-5-hydroxy-6-metoxy-1,4-benzoquinol methylase